MNRRELLQIGSVLSLSAVTGCLSQITGSSGPTLTDAATWTTEFGSVVDTIRYTDDSVYVGGSTDLKCIERGTGEVVWERTVEPTDTLESDCFLEHFDVGTDYIAYNFCPDMIVAPRETGEARWKSSSLTTHLAIVDDLVLQGGENARALDLRTGEERWRADAPFYAPTRVDDDVFCAYSPVVNGYELSLYRLGDGKKVAELDSFSKTTRQRFVPYSEVIVQLYSKEKYGIRAVDESGIKWELELRATRPPEDVVFDESVVLVDSSKVRSIDPQTGAVQWDRTVEGRELNSAGVSNGQVFLGDDQNDRILVLNGASGEVERESEQIEDYERLVGCDQGDLYVSTESTLVSLEAAVI